jgi:hypothetical protein
VLESPPHNVKNVDMVHQLSVIKNASPDDLVKHCKNQATAAATLFIYHFEPFKTMGTLKLKRDELIKRDSGFAEMTSQSYFITTCDKFLESDPSHAAAVNMHHSGGESDQSHAHSVDDKRLDELSSQLKGLKQKALDMRQQINKNNVAELPKKSPRARLGL